MKVVNKLVVAAAVCAMAVSVTSATIVSWNLNDWSDSPTDASATAGVGPYAASYWNDTWLDGLSNPSSDLRDSTGATTTLDISWSSYGTWSYGASHPGADTDGSMNKEMLRGYLNSGPAGWGPWTTESSVTFTQIQYNASYDVVVYISSDGADREFSVTDGTTTYYGKTVGAVNEDDGFGNALFAQGTDTSTNGYATTANYFVFSGLTGDAKTITAQFRDNDEWGGIAGIQVVGVIPEPATIGLVGIFGAGVLFVRRRFRI